MHLQAANQQAYMAHHNLRFEQLHSSLSLMEFDMDVINAKGDDTLLW